jgi:hypothetical protein
MSTASRIRKACEGADAYSLRSGYALHDGGTKKLQFKPGACVEERRNDAGRVTRAGYTYPDGSRLTFTWSERNGPKLEAAARS